MKPLLSSLHQKGYLNILVSVPGMRNNATHPAGNYMFKVNNRNTRRRCEIYLKLKVWCLYCFLWTYITPCYSVSIVSFEHVNAGWVCSYWNSFHTHTYILTKENCIEKLQQKTDERVHILQRNFSEPTMNLYNDALHDLARFIQFYTA